MNVKASRIMCLVAIAAVLAIAATAGAVEPLGKQIADGVWIYIDEAGASHRHSVGLAGLTWEIDNLQQEIDNLLAAKDLNDPAVNEHFQALMKQLVALDEAKASFTAEADQMTAEDDSKRLLICLEYTKAVDVTVTNYGAAFNVRSTASYGAGPACPGAKGSALAYARSSSTVETSEQDQQLTCSNSFSLEANAAGYYGGDYCEHGSAVVLPCGSTGLVIETYTYPADC